MGGCGRGPSLCRPRELLARGACPAAPRGGPAPPRGAGRGFFQDKLRARPPPPGPRRCAEVSAGHRVRHNSRWGETSPPPNFPSWSRALTWVRSGTRQRRPQGPRLVAPGVGPTAGSPPPVPRREPATRRPLPGAAKAKSRADKGLPAGDTAPPPVLPGKARLGGTRSSSSSSRAARSAGLPMARTALARLGSAPARLRRAPSGGGGDRPGRGAAQRAGEAQLENSSLSPSLRLAWGLPSFRRLPRTLARSGAPT